MTLAGSGRAPFNLSAHARPGCSISHSEQACSYRPLPGSWLPNPSTATFQRGLRTLINSASTGTTKSPMGLRIPAKLDTDSTPSWTRIPEQAGQSERSDAGFWCFTLRMPSGSSFQSVSADADWLFQRLNRSATQSYPRPAARLRSYHSRLAGGRRWITRRTCGEGHGVTSGHSGFPFLRSDSPSRLRLCA